ncbi:hypothetical protein BJX64DRAFT_291054 [Aspergillus heterothallicus]
MPRIPTSSCSDMGPVTENDFDVATDSSIETATEDDFLPIDDSITQGECRTWPSTYSTNRARSASLNQIQATDAWVKADRPPAYVGSTTNPDPESAAMITSTETPSNTPNDDHLLVLRRVIQDTSRGMTNDMPMSQNELKAMRRTVEELKMYRFFAWIGDYPRNLCRCIRGVHEQRFSGRQGILGPLYDPNWRKQYTSWIGDDNFPSPGQTVTHITICVNDFERRVTKVSMDHVDVLAAFTLYNARNTAFHSIPIHGDEDINARAFGRHRLPEQVQTVYWRYKKCKELLARLVQFEKESDQIPKL